MTQVFEKILEISIQASILAILILIARKIVIKRSNFFMNVLFTLLIIRLIVPISIQSPLSIQNIFSTSNVTKVGHAIIDDITQVEGNIAPTQSKSFDSFQAGDTSISLSQNANPRSPTDKRQNLSIIDIASIVWLFGVVLLTACIVINNILFRLRLAKNRAYDDESFLRLMAECKETLGIKQNIPIIQTNGVNTAAVHGAISPILLISKSSFESLNMEERRQILIHELLHIKRRDTMSSLLTIILNIIHWFNPVLWITFIIMRKDLEVMCDADVIKRIGHEHKHSYATTLVKLIKINSSKSSSPMTTLSVDTDIKRRITMISKQRKNTVLFSIISIIITIVIVITGCTTKTDDKEEDAIGIIGGPDGPTQVFIAKKVATPELIGTFSLEYDSKDEAMVSNIKKACDILNNTLIPPEGIISLNQILGERAKDNGWKTDINGGLCRFTSTLYNSALIAELQIIDLSHHSTPINYISGGLGAMINYGTDDFILKNPYDNDVKIIATAENGILKIDIYGAPRDYTVDITSELVETGEMPEYEYKYNCDTLPNGDSIPEGESKIHIKPQPRQTFNIIKTLYDLDGKEIERSVIDTCTYNERKGTIYVNAPRP